MEWETPRDTCLPTPATAAPPHGRCVKTTRSQPDRPQGKSDRAERQVTGAWLWSWSGSQSGRSHSTWEQSWRCSNLGHGRCAPRLLPGEGATLRPDHVEGGLGSEIYVYLGTQTLIEVNTGAIQFKASQIKAFLFAVLHACGWLTGLVVVQSVSLNVF